MSPVCRVLVLLSLSLMGSGAATPAKTNADARIEALAAKIDELVLKTRGRIDPNVAKQMTKEQCMSECVRAVKTRALTSHT